MRINIDLFSIWLTSKKADSYICKCVIAAKEILVARSYMRW